jgi:membrane protein implicated in regulation of membrane protease activity
MNADALELVFTGSAVLGTALLLLSSIGAGMHVRLHLPSSFRIPHVRIPFLRATSTEDATGLPVLLGFLAMFGIGGLFGAVAFGLGPVGRTAVALAFGAFGAGVAFAIFAALKRAEGHEPTSLRDLIGRKARVVVSIGERGHGTVTLTYDGAVQSLPATARVPIARGYEVEILGVQGMAVTVRSLPPP